MKTQVIIVTYKTSEDEIKRLKKEIEKINLGVCNFSIIDNSKNNKGFAGGVNEGIRKGINNNVDYFLILNPDVSLKTLAEKDIFLASKAFDIWGFTIKQDEIFYYGGEIDKLRMSGGLIKDKPLKRFASADFVSGSLMMVKRKVVDRIGIFNEDYFMYYEDVDYCYRAKKAGFKTGIDSQLFYTHFETSKIYSKKEEFLAKNRKRFLWKYGSIKQKIYEILKSLSSKKFLINFLSLNFSSFINKIFNFILFIFLVRYFSAKDYGLYNLVWGYIGFFAPFLDFGTTSYGLVYLAGEKNSQFNVLNSLRFFLSIIIFGLVLISTLIFKLDKQFILLIFLVSITIFSNMWSGSYLIINSLKQKVFNSSIISVIFNFVLTIALIWTVTKYKNLYFIFVIIALFYLIYTLINIFLVKNELNKLKLIFNPAKWIEILKKSYVFVLIGFSAGLYFKQDIFLLNYFKSDREVGIYSAGYKFFEALLFIVGGYNITATPVFSKLKKNVYDLKRKIKKDFVFLLLLGTMISISFYLLSPFVLPLLLKQNFEQSIIVAKIVIFALPFVFLSSIFLNLLYVYGKPFLVLMIFIFQILVNLILNILLIPKFSFIASAYITVLSEIINFTLAYLFAKKYIK